MTQPTDDLAAQMVREMFEINARGKTLTEYATEHEAIARRYMEKLFSEDELRRMAVLTGVRCGWIVGLNSASTNKFIEDIRAERAGKDGR